VNIRQAVLRKMVPDVHLLAPNLNSSFVHQTVQRAVHGIGPLPPAASAAEKQLTEQDGVVEDAIHELIENHASLAAAQGFVTNLGGLATMAATVPVNITGLALLQIRLVAGIAHLRGYDLADPRVRNAILACILGEDAVSSAVKKRRIPARPLAIATAPTHDPQLDRVMAAEVTSELIARATGKRLATVVGRRVPVVGGLVGAGVDGYATWKIGRYADRELVPRSRLNR
jgi:hypothetical protein